MNGVVLIFFVCTHEFIIFEVYKFIVKQKIIKLVNLGGVCFIVLGSLLCSIVTLGLLFSIQIAGPEVQGNLKNGPQDGRFYLMRLALLLMCSIYVPQWVIDTDKCKISL